MTPAERKLVTELFDRLATLEDAQRDPDAEKAIRDGLAQAPNAVYALVQTALVQDEAMAQAHARIQALEAELANVNPPQQQGGFLDNMRGSIWGRQSEPRGSVPNVRPGDSPMGAPPGFGSPPMGSPQMGNPQMGGPGGYGPQGQMPPEPQPQGRGGSFLGTAAAAAAGVVGGSLLLDSIRGMTGGGQRSGHALADQAHAGGLGGGGGGLPWNNRGGSDELSRQAGLDDIGRSSGSGAGPFGQSQGAFGGGDRGGGKSGDNAEYEHTHAGDSDVHNDDDADFDDGDFDDGGFDSDE